MLNCMQFLCILCGKKQINVVLDTLLHNYFIIYLYFIYFQIPDVRGGGGGVGSSGLIHFLVCCNLYATLKINKNTELH